MPASATRFARCTEGIHRSGGHIYMADWIDRQWQKIDNRGRCPEMVPVHKRRAKPNRHGN